MVLVPLLSFDFNLFFLTSNNFCFYFFESEIELQSLLFQVFLDSDLLLFPFVSCYEKVMPIIVPWGMESLLLDELLQLFLYLANLLLLHFRESLEKSTLT